MELNIKVNDEKEAEKILKILSTLQQDIDVNIEDANEEKEYPKEEVDTNDLIGNGSSIYEIMNDSIYKLEESPFDIDMPSRNYKFRNIFTGEIHEQYTVNFNNLFNKNKLIKELEKRKKTSILFDYTDHDACLEAVKNDPYALQYVKVQTHDICMEAVKKNGYSLKHIKEQTEDICLEAVKQNGLVLMYVKEQTEDICLAAVKQNGYALRYVKEQTEELCMEAVKQYSLALQYVREQTEDICMEAIKEYGIKNVINYIDIDVIDKLLEEYDVEGK